MTDTPDKPDPDWMAAAKKMLQDGSEGIEKRKQAGQFLRKQFFTLQDILLHGPKEDHKPGGKKQSKPRGRKPPDQKPVPPPAAPEPPDPRRRLSAKNLLDAETLRRILDRPLALEDDDENDTGY